MIEIITKKLNRHPKTCYLVLFIVWLICAYVLLIHRYVISWIELKQLHTQLSLKQQAIAFRKDASNPLQHDQIIHLLIQAARQHHVEILSTQFTKIQQTAESFSCELEGGYANSKKFIEVLLNSGEELVLKKLQMHSQTLNNQLVTQLVFEHEL